MQPLTEGQLVTISGDRSSIDGIVFQLPSSRKAVVAVPDQQRGAVLRTVAQDTVSERETESVHDEELRRLIRRSHVTQRGAGATGATGGRGGGPGHSSGPAHRAAGR